MKNRCNYITRSQEMFYQIDANILPHHQDILIISSVLLYQMIIFLYEKLCLVIFFTHFITYSHSFYNTISSIFQYIIIDPVIHLRPFDKYITSINRVNENR